MMTYNHKINKRNNRLIFCLSVVRASEKTHPINIIFIFCSFDRSISNIMLRISGSLGRRQLPRHLGTYERACFFSSTEVSNGDEDRPKRKRLDVAIVGAPNAGKSQLLNVLTQSKVAAVSRKRHTTRSDILGARTVGDTQIVFKDTPGFLKLENAKEERLDRDLIVTAAAELQHVDYSLLVVDAARALNNNYRHALIQLMVGSLNSTGRIEEDDVDDDQKSKKSQQNPWDNYDSSRFAIVLNKVDLVNPKKKLLDTAMDIGNLADACLMDQYNRGGQDQDELNFDRLMDLSPVVFYVSALENDGVDEILDHLVERATPCRTWVVEAGEATNMTKHEQVQELIREKIYRCLHQEVPHSIHQVNRMFRKVKAGMIIHQDLVVFSKSHQKLIIGSGGKTLKRIQDSATRDLKELFDCDISLRLHVKLNKSKQRRNIQDYS